MSVYLTLSSSAVCLLIPVKENTIMPTNPQNPHALPWLSYLNVSFTTAFRYDSLLMIACVIGSPLFKCLLTS
jgi:hypothetical protein